MKTLTILIFSLLVSISSYAQPESGEKGNGGGGFDCVNSVIVLDSVEGARRGFHSFMGGNTSKNVIDRINFVADQFAKLDYLSSNVLRQKALAFTTDILDTESKHLPRGKYVYFSKEPLKITDDSLETFKAPLGCSKVQIVTQKTPVFAEDRLLEIDSSLWARMDDDQRALMILHEAIYAILIERRKESNSVFVRYYNENITDESFQKQTICEYMREILLQKKFANALAENVGKEIHRDYNEVISSKATSYRANPLYLIYLSGEVRCSSGTLDFIERGQLQVLVKTNTASLTQKWNVSSIRLLNQKIQGFETSGNPILAVSTQLFSLHGNVERCLERAKRRDEYYARHNTGVGGKDKNVAVVVTTLEFTQNQFELNSPLLVQHVDHASIELRSVRCPPAYHGTPISDFGFSRYPEKAVTIEVEKVKLEVIDLDAK